MEQPPSIFPLGDSAITIDLGNHIDEQLNRKALAIYNALQALHLPGIRDIIAAYSSVSVFYDPERIIAENPSCPDGAFACMKKRLQETWKAVETSSKIASSLPDSINIIRLPVCYEAEYGPDQNQLAREKGLLREDIIRLHTAKAYQVYMIGFLPGFPYLGKVDPELEISRKQRPVPVVAGGVGIAGNQTGIYPLNSPGGWQIIGRTPLKLFDPYAAVPVRLKVGDWVQFFSVTKQEFQDLVTRSNG
ncbi:MAG TPA: 5-oxoprolinase subunit PxpB [Puia sp.]|nr:5-oxoprolinase subunit PxpB [Puia sp.]